MSTYDELQSTVLTWGLNIAADSEFEEELLDTTITASYPKKWVEPKNWEIFRIEYYFDALNRTVMTFHIKVMEKTKQYYQRVRVYSPHIPVIKDLNELLGCKVIGVKAIVSARNPEDDRPVLIVPELKLLKKSGKRCNISVRLEEEKSPLLDLSDEEYPIVILEEDAEVSRNYMAKKTQTEIEYVSQYFPERDIETILQTVALIDYQNNK